MTIGYDMFAKVAADLGFTIEPRENRLLLAEHTIEGSLDGVHVKVWQWQGQFVHVEYTAWLSPPADMRLHVQREGIVGKLGHLFGKHDIEVGDPEFDRAWKVKADEPARAQALLNPEVRKVLAAWKKADLNVRITDETVHFWMIPGSYRTVAQDELVQNIRALAAIVTVLNAAMKNVPPSTALAPHVDAWRAYANARGLQFSASPLRVTGKLEGSNVVARAVAIEDDAWGVDLSLAFETRLPFGLEIRAARFFDFMRSGEAPRVELGDAEFERELCVTSTEPPKAKAFLDESVRRALLELHRSAGDVQLDARGISVRTKSMTDPSAFGQIAERVATVARKLSEQAGPYR
jgi:hypothetical protein